MYENVKNQSEIKKEWALHLSAKNHIWLHKILTSTKLNGHSLGNLEGLEFWASHVGKAVGYEATTIGNGIRGIRSNIYECSPPLQPSKSSRSFDPWKWGHKFVSTYRDPMTHW
jgi:hypothetical protein